MRLNILRKFKTYRALEYRARQGQQKIKTRYFETEKELKEVLRDEDYLKTLLKVNKKTKLFLLMDKKSVHI